MQQKSRFPGLNFFVDWLEYSVPIFLGFCFIMVGLMSGHIIMGTICGVGIAGSPGFFFRVYDRWPSLKIKKQPTTDEIEHGRPN